MKVCITLFFGPSVGFFNQSQARETSFPQYAFILHTVDPVKFCNGQWFNMWCFFYFCKYSPGRVCISKQV